MPTGKQFTKVYFEAPRHLVFLIWELYGNGCGLWGLSSNIKVNIKYCPYSCNRWLLVNLSLHSIRIPHLRSNSQHNDPSRRKLQKLGQWTKYNQHIDASQNPNKTFFEFWWKKSCIIICIIAKIQLAKKVSEVEKLKIHLGQGEIRKRLWTVLFLSGLTTSTASLSSKKRRVDPFVLVIHWLMFYSSASK